MMPDEYTQKLIDDRERARTECDEYRDELAELNSQLQDTQADYGAVEAERDAALADLAKAEERVAHDDSGLGCISFADNEAREEAMRKLDGYDKEHTAREAAEARSEELEKALRGLIYRTGRVAETITSGNVAHHTSWMRGNIKEAQKALPFQPDDDNEVR